MAVAPTALPTSKWFLGRLLLLTEKLKRMQKDDVFSCLWGKIEGQADVRSEAKTHVYRT